VRAEIKLKKSLFLDAASLQGLGERKLNFKELSL